MRTLGWITDGVVLPRVARVAAIHVPPDDVRRLRDAITAPFVLCPNHPEFFTDWMLDKWITGRFAPMAASWADPLIVNGMGAAMRQLWLSNGLVAAVHGSELERALAYSGQVLARGHGALIHPEGEVNWDNASLGPLRAGAVRIAEHGAALAGRAAHLVPLAWFIRFREDATPGLQRELDYVEQRLEVHVPRLAGPAQRLGALFDVLLEREARTFDITLGPRDVGFAQRFHDGLARAVEMLGESWPEYRPASLPEIPEEAARVWRSTARKISAPAAEFKKPIAALDRMLRLVPSGLVEPTVTQEQVGERIKRLRLDWLRGTTRDAITRFVPRAAATRDVFIRVSDAVVVTAPSDHGATLALLRERMEGARACAQQDGLDRLGPPVRYANPFLA